MPADDSKAIIGIDAATAHQDCSRSNSHPEDIATAKLKNLLREAYRLPEAPLTATTRAELETAVAAIKRFFKINTVKPRTDEKRKAAGAGGGTPPYEEWKDVNKAGFFQGVLQQYPHHCALVMDFVENHPAEMKRLMDNDAAEYTAKLTELMAEDYRLPRFDNNLMDVAAQADLAKALAAIDAFFEDADSETVPEVLDYEKWNYLSKTRVFQEVELRRANTRAAFEFLKQEWKGRAMQNNLKGAVQCKKITAGIN
ncbi:hypothetical protein HDU96_010515 [Phlyctochytrium bullatum]|nr:hypothetical protein HDU96_010515 [Phlyctochytrium bullatum]